MQYLIFLAFIKFVSFIEFLIFVRCILSWFPINRDNKLIRIIYILTEPLLGPFRSIINKSPLGKNLMIDFSPILAILFLGLLVRLLSTVLF